MTSTDETAGFQIKRRGVEPGIGIDPKMVRFECSGVPCRMSGIRQQGGRVDGKFLWGLDECGNRGRQAAGGHVAWG
ncbi:hypothetical protein DSCA_55080 [Desulfosarcina alkanivorans]|uniref:Uncharacterized protein n=1 Tax=Desulfosarcina alkanivorans TaxID=571177 RepID=A0A5K7YSF6_9BACT|nr:hypothetical protein DSCA_55080 [Desulfosarcina alkanivorans]